MEGLSSDMRELGRNWAMLSRFEEAVQAKVGQYTAQGVSAGNRAADLNKAAFGSVKQHSVWRQLSVKTAASLAAGTKAGPGPEINHGETGWHDPCGLDVPPLA
ncbi:subunit of retromer complex [Haematococcus lacustris]|uniref:Subunit of retromer complex n=1 Tax=Haematococcus lacustris TaxID=44745 RepID=A0A699ZT07_HAELA|nr:subunit of retromer complex [Haematococcus lacustris]